MWAVDDVTLQLSHFTPCDADTSYWYHSVVGSLSVSLAPCESATVCGEEPIIKNIHTHVIVCVCVCLCEERRAHGFSYRESANDRYDRLGHNEWCALSLSLSLQDQDDKGRSPLRQWHLLVSTCASSSTVQRPLHLLPHLLSSHPSVLQVPQLPQSWCWIEGERGTRWGGVDTVVSEVPCSCQSDRGHKLSFIWGFELEKSKCFPKCF